MPSLFNPAPLEIAFEKLMEGAKNTEDGEMSNAGEDAAAAMALVRAAHDETTKLLYAHMRSLAEQQDVSDRAEAVAKHHKEMVCIYEKNIEEHNARWKTLNDATMRVSELNTRVKEMSLENERLARLLKQQCVCRRFPLERIRICNTRCSRNAAPSAEATEEEDTLSFDERLKDMMAVKELTERIGHNNFVHLKCDISEAVNEEQVDVHAKTHITDGLLKLSPRTATICAYIDEANELVQSRKLVLEQARAR
jgi:hypothetical protein